MYGLRDQRDKMMTWVSLRSGVASSGRCVMDQAPQAQAAATSANTRYLFLTENSIIRLSMRASVRAQNLCMGAVRRPSAGFPLAALLCRASGASATWSPPREVAYLHACCSGPGRSLRGRSPLGGVHATL